MQDQEIWKDVVGFESRYSVSNTGRVFSKLKNKFIKLGTNKGGYLFFTAKDSGYCKNLLVHRQVAILFLDEPSKELEDKCSQEHHGKVLVNHIDGNKQNNSSTNLEWSDGHRNMQHAVRTGLLTPPVLCGTDNHKSVVKDLAVVEAIRKEYVKFSREYGTTALAKKYGLPPGVVRRIANYQSYL